MKRAINISIALTSLVVASAARPPAQATVPFSIDVSVPVLPTRVASHGRMHLFYEIHLLNMSSHLIRLEEIRLIDDRGRVRESLKGDLLRTDMWRPGASSDRDKLALDGGMIGAVFMELA